MPCGDKHQERVGVPKTTAGGSSGLMPSPLEELKTVTELAAGGNLLDEVGKGGVLRRGPAEDVGRHIRVLQLEQFEEPSLVLGAGGHVMGFQIAHEQRVEFLHATPTAPTQPRELATALPGHRVRPAARQSVA